MNYLLNRPNYPFNDVKVPDGLEQLMEDLSREVLRAQPNTDGIYDFVATYLEKLVNTRDTLEGIEQLLTGITNRAADIAQDLRNDGLENKKADDAAEIVRSYFNEFIENRRQEKYSYPVQFQIKEIDIILELMNKCKLSQMEVLRSQPVIFKAYLEFLTNYLKALEGAILPSNMMDCILQMTIDKYIAEMPSISVLNKAAISIQAAYRGYYIRKKIKDFKHLVNKTSEHSNVKWKWGAKSDMEVVLFILNYYNANTSSDDLQIKPGSSKLKQIVKSVTDENLSDFLKISTQTRGEEEEEDVESLSFDCLSIEDAAAIRIQRVFRRYRLKLSQIPKFSILKRVSEFGNLLDPENSEKEPKEDDIDDEIT